jgi:hypothetical protein
MHKHKQESADYSIEETHSACLKAAAVEREWGRRRGKSIWGCGDQQLC